jgi:outer membrane protein
MRKLLITLATALALAPAARADVKIAIVDQNAAMEENEEGKATLANLNKELEDKRKIVEAKQKEFAAAQADFEKQASVMNDQTKAAKEAELQKKFEELQGMAQQGEQELGGRLAEARKGIEARMRAVVKEIAEAEGFTVVLDARAVVFGTSALDITSEVIRKYNGRFPYKGPKAPAPAAGAKAGAKPAGAKAK